MKHLFLAAILFGLYGSNAFAQWQTQNQPIQAMATLNAAG
jgi:hypothetical protein